MRKSSISLGILPACLLGIHANFLGPIYPAPFDLSSKESLVAASWTNLTSSLENYLNEKENTASEAISALRDMAFSIGMFSIHDPLAAKSLQFHYTSAEIANSTQGVNKLDGDSIYRVASISKLVTVYTGLLELGLGSRDWNWPIGDFVPKLAQFARRASGEDNPINTTQWDKITLGALAAQMGGGPRDAAPWAGGDLLYVFESLKAPGEDESALLKLGLPPLNISDPTILPPCLKNLEEPCREDPFIEGIQSRHPVFLPWTGPAYSDASIMLLGLAISNITGKSLDIVYRESIFDPLKMGSSNSKPPAPSNYSRSVIAGTLSSAGFVGDFGISEASGGIFSTTNELAKLGIGILNSTLLPASETRRWMKPIAHTALLQYSVGQPWEIMRYTHKSSGRITDMYTKLGDAGYYGGYIVLLPDYDAGFSILGASTSKSRSDATALIGDLVAESILPALEAEAAREARHNFAGTYTSSVEGLNSSLTLFLNGSAAAGAAAASADGLTISSWISNGTDVLSLLPSMGFKSSQLRLLPSIIPNNNNNNNNNNNKSRTSQVAFRATAVTDAPATGLFSGQYALNWDWLSVDAVTYGGVGLDLFVFDIQTEDGKGNGKAVAVTPGAMRARLKRTN